MLLLTCAAFVSIAAMRVCDSMLPEIAKNFDTSNGQAASTITAFAVAYGLFQFIYGPLGDRYDKYRLITLAAFACAVSSIAAAAAPFLGWLICARALAGATAAGMVPLSIAWIGDSVPYEERQETLARFISGPILGLIGGQFLGGLVADTLGWRWCFFLLALMYIVIGLLLQSELKRRKSTHPQPAAESSASGRPALLAQFTSVLRVKWVWLILAIAYLEAFSLFGSVAFIPVYLHTKFGLSLTASGAVMAVFGLGGLSYTIIAGRLISRIGERGIAISGGFLLGCSFLALLLITHWPWAIPASFATGMGYYMLHNTLQTNATQMAPFARGTAISLFVACFFLGQSMGVALGGAVFDHAGVPWLFASSAAILPLLAVGFSSALLYRKTKHGSSREINSSQA
jgi:predicted MFS family arabinose efflux permease